MPQDDSHLAATRGLSLVPVAHQGFWYETFENLFKNSFGKAWEGFVSIWTQIVPEIGLAWPGLACLSWLALLALPLGPEWIPRHPTWRRPWGPAQGLFWGSRARLGKQGQANGMAVFRQ